jgi:tetratricopeptide (TPR) repeat protein
MRTPPAWYGRFVRPTAEEAGSLEQISFALLLIRALDKRWSGTLTLDTPDGLEQLIQLDRGLVSRVLVPDGYARLGDIVVEAGVVMESELELALASEGLLGQALAGARLIDAKTLQRALVLQLLKRLVRNFELPVETRWTYSPEAAAFDGLPEGVRIDTLRVLWAGLSAHGETGSWIAATLRRIGESPFQVRSDVNLRRFGFTGDARNLVRIIRDEHCTVRDIVDQAVAPESITHLIVYLLAITRHLDFAPAGTSQTLSGIQIDDESSTDSVSASSDQPSSDSHPQLAGAPEAQTSKLQRVARIKLRRVPLRGDRDSSTGDVPRDRPSDRLSDRPRDRPSDRPSDRPRDRPSDRWSDRSDDRPSDHPWVELHDEPDLPRDHAVTVPSADVRNHLFAEIKSRLARLEHESALSLLNLDADDFDGKSDDEATEIAWDALERASRRWHPDACPRELSELRGGMARIHDAMTQAFEVLVDPARRRTVISTARRLSDAQPRWAEDARLDERKSAPSDPASGRRAARDIPPHKLHERALMAFAQQRYHEALRLCRQACDRAPGEPDYLATSVWIRAQLEHAEVDLLLLDLDDVLRNHPAHVTARYYRAILLRRIGRYADARHDLDRVLALEPDHEGARQLESLISSVSLGNG